MSGCDVHARGIVAASQRLAALSDFLIVGDVTEFGLGGVKVT